MKVMDSMDTSPPIPNAKKQKLSEEHNLNEGKSLMCKQADVILQGILPFLSTKEVVRISILSKKWQNQCMSVPDLVFKEQEVQGKRELFMNFVERLLKLRESSNLRKLMLSCDVLSDASRIIEWIVAAMRCKVQELDLCLTNIEEPFVLPPCLFTCDSLTVLEINMTYHLELPALISFSSLRSLSLVNVVLPQDYLMQKLLSGCPVLEGLTIFYCDWRNLKGVWISSPMLKKISIRHGTEENGGCQVVIFGTSLESFSLEGELRNEYCLFNSYSLVDVSIDLKAEGSNLEDLFLYRRNIAYRFYKILKGLGSVKCLKLSNDALEVLACADELFAHLPVFCNLKHLKFIGTHAVNLTSKALWKVAELCPYLSAIDFTRGFEGPQFDDLILQTVPSCFSTHLKTIKTVSYLRMFPEAEKEVQLLGFLLKLATSLEKISITCFCFEEQKVAEAMLLRLPRAPNCDMVVKFQRVETCEAKDYHSFFSATQ